MPKPTPVYRKVSTEIWNDEIFLSLDLEAKFLFLRILTDPAMTSIGAMRSNFAGLADELDWDLETLTDTFQILSENGMVKGSPKGRLICLPNFLRHNPPANLNVVKGWGRVIPTLPECELKVEYLQGVRAYLLTLDNNLIQTFNEIVPDTQGKPFPIPLPISRGNGTPTQEQEQEQEQEREREQDKIRNPSPNPAPPPPFFVSQIFKTWNATADEFNLPQAQKLTHSRIKLIEERMKDSWWAENWKPALEKIPYSLFLTGQAKPGKGYSEPFEANFNWFLKPDSVAQIMEGNYDNPPPQTDEWANVPMP